MKTRDMEAFITGIGWVSRESMGYATRIQPFAQKTTLPQIERKDLLSHSYKPFGRMDTFSKLGFAAIVFAMKDAGIKKDEGKKDICMIASTVTGCLEADINFQETLSRTLPSPTVFAYTLPTSFLGEAAIYFGLSGESFVIHEEKTHGLKGLFMALEIIASGESDTVLCGLCNSDIKTITAGSLFFVLQKQSLHSYGTIKSTSLENHYYQNNIRITGLYDLAQKSRNRKK